MNKITNGYISVDATGLDLNSLGKVAGLCASLKTACSVGKPIILSGVKNSTALYSPAYITAYDKGASGVGFVLDGVAYTVNTSDTVSADV